MKSSIAQPKWIDVGDDSPPRDGGRAGVGADADDEEDAMDEDKKAAVPSFVSLVVVLVIVCRVGCRCLCISTNL